MDSARSPTILVGEPSLGGGEKSALADVIDTGWITMGDRVRSFELAFARRHRATDAVAVSSGTAALHLALLALGIGPGDEVLVPSLTFVATANAVLYTGATPIFVDIDSTDLPLLSLSGAADRCTAKTRAMVVVHYAGYLADRDACRAFASSRRLLLIEDAAHAAGAEGYEMAGDAAAFSFFGNKNMTTAEGGMVIAADAEVLARARQLRSHGTTRSTLPHGRGPSLAYDVNMLGYNYRMDELRAAIGLEQLTRLASWNETRGTLARTYRTLLEEHCPDVVVPFSQPRASAYHIFPVLLPERIDRARVIEDMVAAGVQTSMHYPPAHLFSLYREKLPAAHLPKTEDFARRELTLPLHPKLEAAQLEYVVRMLAASLARQR
jgi:dTDP-4-amino-4,6-dideoxygalactose transaminase